MAKHPMQPRRPIDRAKSVQTGQRHTTSGSFGLDEPAPTPNPSPARIQRTTASVATDQRIRSALRGMGVRT
jgi:hypothetical protein